MNSKIKFILALSSIAILASCGGKKEVEDNYDGYQVTVVYPDGTAVKENEASVQFCTSTSCLPSVETDKKGRARIDLDDGNYYVHLITMPNGYTYNPNIYTLSASNKQINLELVEIKGSVNVHSLQPGEEAGIGSGLGLYDARYKVSEGAYQITLEDEDATLYIEYSPKEAGLYAFESWAVDKLATNVIDPVIGFCGSQRNYQHEMPTDIYTSGGIGKNFKHEVGVSWDEFFHLNEEDEEGNLILQKDEEGNPICGTNYTFAIKLANAQRYPATFTLNIEREGDYTVERTVAEVIHANETRVSPEAPEGKSLRFCELDGSDVPVYNPVDKYWHLNSEDGDLLYASLKGDDNPLLETSLEIASQKQGLSYYITDNGTKDYNEFMQSYYNLCNSNGHTPVTTELKEALNAIQKQQIMFYDAEHDIVGFFGNIAAPGFEWLFTVGYYSDKLGSSEEYPIMLKSTDESTIVEILDANETLHFKALAKVDCTWKLTCNNETIEFSIDGESFVGREEPIEITLLENESKTFTVKNLKDDINTLIINVEFIPN